MSYLVIAAAAVLVSGLTLFSGFGLGTLLMPAFALFFPVEVAVAATAIVHAANNVFKIIAVGRAADRSLVVEFGVPAIGAAFVGAAALGYISRFGNLATYALGARTAVVTPLKLVMAGLMIVFSLFELLPALRGLRFDRRHLFLGGLLSGFFGGLSGHQGAMRSAFLVKTGISSESFVATSAVIGFLVDMARIATYAVLLALAGAASPIAPEHWGLILTGVVAAFAGVVIGKRFVGKVTMKSIQTATGILLLAIALALGSGLV